MIDYCDDDDDDDAEEDDSEDDDAEDDDDDDDDDADDDDDDDDTLTRLSLASRTLAAAAVHTPIISLVNVWCLLPMWHKHTTLKSCSTSPTR